MNELVKELKDEIIEALNLEEMTADDIDENEALFGDGLGLDSIDALELIVLLERNTALNWIILLKERKSSRTWLLLLIMSVRTERNK